MDEKQSFGQTSLHLAASKNDASQVKRSLSLGADVNVKSPKLSWTPLHYAADKNLADSHFDTIEELLKRGADVNAQDEEGNTPLNLIMERASTRIIKLFLDHKADVNLKNHRYVSPWKKAIKGEHAYWKCKKGYSKMIKFFLTHDPTNVSRLDFKEMLRMTRMMDLLVREYVKFYLKYSDVNETGFRKSKNILRKTNDAVNHYYIIKHVASLRALNLPVDSGILEVISSNEEHNDYFKRCTRELELAKNTKVPNCWITFFNLLFDSKRRLKNYAGNNNLARDLIERYEFRKFPIFGAVMEKNIVKGTRRRMLFHISMYRLSNRLPIFNPEHLVIEAILDSLTMKDLMVFTSFFY